MPTAIQLAAATFVVFNDNGASFRPAAGERIPLSNEYWALADSNDRISQPCEVFQISPVRHVIQASSPKQERYKEWIKQSRGRVVVSDLPSMLEILAIVYVICPNSFDGEG